MGYTNSPKISCRPQYSCWNAARYFMNLFLVRRSSPPPNEISRWMFRCNFILQRDLPLQFDPTLPAILRCHYSQSSRLNDLMECKGMSQGEGGGQVETDTGREGRKQYNTIQRTSDKTRHRTRNDLLPKIIAIAPHLFDNAVLSLKGRVGQEKSQALTRNKTRGKKRKC
jgi:hypothetical protein